MNLEIPGKSRRPLSVVPHQVYLQVPLQVLLQVPLQVLDPGPGYELDNYPIKGHQRTINMYTNV